MSPAAILLVAALAPTSPPLPPETPMGQLPYAVMTVPMGPGFTVSCCNASGLAYDSNNHVYVRHGNRWVIAP